MCCLVFVPAPFSRHYTDTVYTHCAKCHRLEAGAWSYLLSPSAGVRRLSSVTSLASSSVRVHVRAVTITLLPNIVSWCCCVVRGLYTLHSTSIRWRGTAAAPHQPPPSGCVMTVYWDSGHWAPDSSLHTTAAHTFSVQTVHCPQSALSALSALSAAVLTQ